MTTTGKSSHTRTGRITGRMAQPVQVRETSLAELIAKKTAELDAQREREAVVNTVVDAPPAPASVPEPDDIEKYMTIVEFCAQRHMSRTLYYRLQKAGRAR